MTAPVQHRPFDTDLIDSTEPLRPYWLPAVDQPPEGWHLGTSEFPHVEDKALIEEEKPA